MSLSIKKMSHDNKMVCTGSKVITHEHTVCIGSVSALQTDPVEVISKLFQN